MKSSLSVASFLADAFFISYLKNLWLPSRQEDIPLSFLLGTLLLYSSYLDLKSIWNWAFIWYVVKVKMNFFHYKYQIDPAPFI